MTEENRKQQEPKVDLIIGYSQSRGSIRCLTFKTSLDERDVIVNLCLHMNRRRCLSSQHALARMTKTLSFHYSKCCGALYASLDLIIKRPVWSSSRCLRWSMPARRSSTRSSPPSFRPPSAASTGSAPKIIKVPLLSATDLAIRFQNFGRKTQTRVWKYTLAVRLAKSWTNFSWQDEPWAEFSSLGVATCHA